MSSLAKIAPYPRNAREATAEVMAAHFTAYAQLHWRIATDHPHPDIARKSIDHFTSAYSVAFLLRELEYSGGGHIVADRAARTLWEDWDVVTGMPVSLHEWLVGYGIDPQAVNKAASDIIAEDAQAENSGGA